MNLPSPALIEALEQRFGKAWLSHEGEQVNVACPFCPVRGKGLDRTGHLGLNFVKNGGVWHCVRCDAGGKDLAKFLTGSQIPSYLYHLGMGSLAEFGRIREGVREVPYDPPVLRLLPPVRRMDSEDFGDSATVHGESLVKKGISSEEADRHALCAGTGPVGQYVIFPFFERLDMPPVYWQGRDATGKAFLRKLNPSSDECSQGKAHWLYGFEFAKRECDVYLVEGALDVISVQSWLLANRGEGHVSLGLQGTILSFPGRDTHPLNSQYGKLASLHPRHVYVLLDPDAWAKAKEMAAVINLCGLPATPIQLFTGDPNEEAVKGTLGGRLTSSPAASLRESILQARF